MFKPFYLTTVLLFLNVILFAQVHDEDYRVYAAIIQTEIRDSTKSVVIIKNSIDSAEKNENTLSTVADLSSNNLSDRNQVYAWTENNKKERPCIIDSNSALLLIDYCKSNIDKFTLTNNFNQKYKTIIIKRFPIRQKFIQQDWKTFYEKYPGCDGIFSFSKIIYYVHETSAIVYYWVKRNGLNGHGALIFMTRNKGEWQMKYKTYLWWN